MSKEPYNLFAGAGSRIPGGDQYEDLLVILKAIIADAGGSLEVSQKNLMFIDKDEMLRVDDVFLDGQMRKVFSIQMKERNQNPEGCVTHAEADETVAAEYRVGKGCGTVIAIITLFAFVYLVWQIIRAMFF